MEADTKRKQVSLGKKCIAVASIAINCLKIQPEAIEYNNKWLNNRRIPIVENQLG